MVERANAKVKETISKLHQKVRRGVLSRDGVNTDLYAHTILNFLPQFNVEPRESYDETAAWHTHCHLGKVTSLFREFYEGDIIKEGYLKLF